MTAFTVRAKLAAIPDGQWSAVAYQDSAREGDETLYRILCTLTKRGDTLHFDFTGTDRQADGLINCTHAGVRGGMTPALLTALCGDIPWAPAGVFRCVEITSEPGSLNDCTFPAGISKGSVASGRRTRSSRRRGCGPSGHRPCRRCRRRPGRSGHRSRLPSRRRPC